jgi:hypothetical protein
VSSLGKVWKTRSWPALALSLLGAGCSAHAGSGANKPSTPSATAKAEPAQPRQAAAPAAPEPATEHVIEEEYDALVVGSADGLYRVEPDGSGSRLISPGAALAPRWLSLSSVLVIRPHLGRGLDQGAALERVTLRDGQRTQLAELPPLTCRAGSTAQNLALDLNDARALRVVHEAHVACLRLRDPNADAATPPLEAEIDLTSGQLTRVTAVGALACKPALPVRAAATPSPCRGDGVIEDDARVVEAVNDYPFTFEHEQLLDTSRPKRPLLALPEYALEEMSPSGRWLVLGSPAAPSDPSSRRLLLLDRQEGALFALSEKPGPWPDPLLRPDEKRKKPLTLPAPIEPATLVPRATEARWLGDAERELLVVGNLVVPPGRASFALPGELVR